MPAKREDLLFGSRTRIKKTYAAQHWTFFPQHSDGHGEFVVTEYGQNNVFIGAKLN